ncbi:helix-turn-helix transcriptional regulator [Changpingibacter yushuensis]|uniref:helix-turn-helix transcriptional regulator n=1 Tax=Changpingibacter yushuensis TaxID=2758440 RepID=UPI001CB71B76|nr:helix-turn-helix transcriptional regulator [Changpingibacter yushuensis]
MDLAKMLGLDLANPTDASAVDMEEARQRLIDKLLSIRNERGMTTQDVAAQLGISRQAVAKIEKGSRDPRLSTLIRYAMAVNAHISFDAIEEDVWFADLKPKPHNEQQWPKVTVGSESNQPWVDTVRRWEEELSLNGAETKQEQSLREISYFTAPLSESDSSWESDSPTSGRSGSAVKELSCVNA